MLGKTSMHSYWKLVSKITVGGTFLLLFYTGVPALSHTPWNPDIGLIGKLETYVRFHGVGGQKSESHSYFLYWTSHHKLQAVQFKQENKMVGQLKANRTAVWKLDTWKILENQHKTY